MIRFSIENSTYRHAYKHTNTCAHAGNKIMLKDARGVLYSSSSSPPLPPLSTAMSIYSTLPHSAVVCIFFLQTTIVNGMPGFIHPPHFWFSLCWSASLFNLRRLLGSATNHMSLSLSPGPFPPCSSHALPLLISELLP